MSDRPRRKDDPARQSIPLALSRRFAGTVLRIFRPRSRARSLTSLRQPPNSGPTSTGSA